MWAAELLVYLAFAAAVGFPAYHCVRARSLMKRDLVQARALERQADLAPFMLEAQRAIDAFLPLTKPIAPAAVAPAGTTAAPPSLFDQVLRWYGPALVYCDTTEELIFPDGSRVPRKVADLGGLGAVDAHLREQSTTAHRLSVALAIARKATG